MPNSVNEKNETWPKIGNFRDGKRIANDKAGSKAECYLGVFSAVGNSRDGHVMADTSEK